MRRSVMAVSVVSTLAGGACAQSAPPPDLDAIRAIAQEQFDRHHLNSLIYQVRIDGEDVLTAALGEAMTGVPATPDSRFRNGSVAITYVAALALRLSEDGALDLDAPIARWLPNLPGADTATVRMLANMTAGYPDHVASEADFVAPFLADPFTHWSPERLVDISLSTPHLFAPGTNWDYSHSGYVILGQAIEAATGQPMHDLMEAYILAPLELTATAGFDTSYIPAPPSIPLPQSAAFGRIRPIGIPLGPCQAAPFR